jgi:hypothetical protein
MSHIEVIDIIVPKNDGNFAVVEDINILGGWRVVPDITARDAIQSGRRKEGMNVYVLSTGETFKLIGGITNDKWSSRSEIDNWVRVIFTATSGQISFTLPSVATDPDTYSLTVNGIEYVRGTDFTVSGTALTWLNTFVLVSGDRLMVAYEL